MNLESLITHDKIKYKYLYQHLKWTPPAGVHFDILNMIMILWYIKADNVSMSLRYGFLYNEGYFHVFNRSTEGITMFCDKEDVERFLLLVGILNSHKRIGTISKLIVRRKIEETLLDLENEPPLVEVCAYSILNNHFHFVLKQISDEGISLFMNKVCGSYSQYFNRKYSRFGTLLQGRFKYIPLENDALVIKMASYVNRNHEVHGVEERLSFASGHDLVMRQKNDDRTFKLHKNIRNFFDSLERYQEISQSTVEDIRKQRQKDKDLFE